MTLVADSDSGPSRAYGGLFWYWLLVATRAKSRFSEVSRAALNCFLPSDGLWGSNLAAVGHLCFTPVVAYGPKANGFRTGWLTSALPTIRTESSHLAVNRGILTHPWGKKSRTSEFRQVFRCGSVATQKCNGNYQYKDQQTQQTKFNHRRVENGA